MNSRYASVVRAGLFAGQVAIVTGAGSGLGRCNAHELVSLGARGVALLGRKLEKLNQVAKEVSDSGGEARCYSCDIREEETVKQTVASILADFGRIDALVNNAGGQFAAPLGRLGTESEVSAAICFLLSPAAAFVSGSCIRVDGAVPNAKRVRDLMNKGKTEPFDGFHLAARPKVLD